MYNMRDSNLGRVSDDFYVSAAQRSAAQRSDARGARAVGGPQPCTFHQSDLHPATRPPHHVMRTQPRNRASFTTHISTCAFASLFCGELYIPDWVRDVGRVTGHVDD